MHSPLFSLLLVVFRSRRAIFLPTNFPEEPTILQNLKTLFSTSLETFPMFSVSYLFMGGH